MMIVRHLLAVLLLPFTVVVAVPYWLLNSWAEIDTRWTVFGRLALDVRARPDAVWLVRGLVRAGGSRDACPVGPDAEAGCRGPYRYIRNPDDHRRRGHAAGEALFFGSLLLAL